MYNKKGFTLIELLIVIAVLAILTTVVVVVLNPAQMLAEARDAQRLSDFSSLQSSVSLYLVAAPSPAMAAGPFCTKDLATCAFTGGTLRDAYSTGGSGWVAINLSSIPSGSPLAILPKDPVNSSTFQYAYKADATLLTYEIDAKLESTKYAPKMLNINDGGNSDLFYEVGTNLAL